MFFPYLNPTSHLNDLPDDVTCNITIYADDNSLYSKSDQESRIGTTTRIDCWIWIWSVAEGGLLISMLEELNLFHLTSSITLVLLIWKWMTLFSRKNHFLRYWGCLSPLNWIGVPYIISIAKIASVNIGTLIRSIGFFLLKLLCISINLS